LVKSIGVQVGSTQPLFIFLSAFVIFLVIVFFMILSPFPLFYVETFLSRSRKCYGTILSDGGKDSPVHVPTLLSIAVKYRKAIDPPQQILLRVELDFIVCPHADNSCCGYHHFGTSFRRPFFPLFDKIVIHYQIPDNPLPSEFFLRKSMNMS
jgi:hypothetical protein